jgi:hypothetical protein
MWESAWLWCAYSLRCIPTSVAALFNVIVSSVILPFSSFSDILD